MPASMREKLRTWSVGSADLIFRDGKFYLHIAVSTEAPEVPEPSGSLVKALPVGCVRDALPVSRSKSTAR